VLDSNDFSGGNLSKKEQEFFDRLPTKPWDGRRCTFTEALDSPNALLALGFYELEEWGVWSRTENPKLVLPFLVHGEVFIEIETVGFGPNIGQEVHMSIGGTNASITLSPHLHTSSHLLHVTEPSRTIEFSNIIPSRLDEVDDPRTMAIGISKISIAAPSLSNATWDGTPTFIDLANPTHNQLDFVGFHSREPWGIWSEIDPCHIILPFSVHGDCEIQFFAQGFGKNIGATITITLGESSAQFELEQEPKQFIFRLKTNHPTHLLHISGLTPDTAETRPGARRMGIGIHRLQVTFPPEGALVPVDTKKRKTIMSALSPKQRQQKALHEHESFAMGITGFTTIAIFNESSNSNQWRDVVSAFLWSFRENPSATLIIQNSNTSIASFFSELMFLFFRVGDIKCRVIAIHTLDPYRDTPMLLNFADLYVHVDSSVTLTNVTPHTNIDSTRFIISSTDNLQLDAENIARITPLRQPIKTPGHLHRVERELENVLDWVRLCDEMKRAYTQWQENHHD
jgi:hypothetical protein